MADKIDGVQKNLESDFPNDYLWPKAGCSLRDLDGPWLDAYLGPTWPEAYILGYQRAAEVLSAHVVSNGETKTIAFPILFLWRHTIELQLKVIVLKAGNLAGSETHWPVGHHLGELWRTARTALDQAGLGAAGEIPTVESIILDLAAFDPDSDGFRYHEKRSGRRTLEDAPDTIDLQNVCEMLAGVTNFLDCVIADLDARLEWSA